MSRHHFSDHPSWKPAETSYWDLPVPEGWTEIRVGEVLKGQHYLLPDGKVGMRVGLPIVAGARRVLLPNINTRAKWALYRLGCNAKVQDLLEIRRIVEEANPGCTPAEIDRIFVECFKIKMREAAEKRKNK